jgi:hypothetical protein
MKDVPSARPGLFMIGEDGLIEENIVLAISPDQRLKDFDLTRPFDPNTVVPAHRALGGVQLGGTCERIRVINNLIIGGIGNGITLGSLRIDGMATVPEEPIRWIPRPVSRRRQLDPAGRKAARTVSAGSLMTF